MIPILMFVFGLGGTFYGMAEETIPFYMLVIPVLIAAGYDALTGLAVVLVGSGIGVLGSTFNPFSTVIASDAASISFSQGMPLRVLILFVCYIVGVIYVMSYASKVKANPSASLVAHLKAENEKHFSLKKEGEKIRFSKTHKIILVQFVLTYGIMIWGLQKRGWWMEEICVIFLMSSIIAAFIAKINESDYIKHFINGAMGMVGVFFVIGIARGIGIVMEKGSIEGTVLHLGEQTLVDLPKVVFVNVMYIVHLFLSILIPSTSGLAKFSMPIMAPLADFAGVNRALAVTAYQTAAGLMNLVTPTYGVVVAALAISRVSIGTWLKFMAPLILVLGILTMAILTTAVVIG